ncbi:HIT-like domain-containing protein [Aspergillus cavernicola]|uniref:HIT-like domain-containing protein n=1 Tax=Aspergillus cavernicola TaxID=176166 RepID=A0ABR4IMA7_9EURO
MSTRPCPFCKIAAAHPPIPTSNFLPSADQSSTSTTTTTTTIAAPANATDTDENAAADPDSHAFLILSTKHVLAFLDIMPLTSGHVLVVPRDHAEKLGEVGVRVSRELGTWLPIISRAVMRTVFSEETREPSSNTDESWNWNVVQNNGVGAAQVVPHVHFHIVPRPPTGAASTKAKMSFVMFGRGQREDLDDEEAESLAGVLRGEIAREVVRVREVERVDVEAEVEEGGVVVGRGRL